MRERGMRQRFEIPGTLPSVNDYTNANRRNPYKGARMKKDTEDVIIWSIKAAKVKPMDAPVHVHITFVEPNMRRDKDNIIGSQKFILDALVKAGVLGDDNWKWIGNDDDPGLSYAFMVNPRNSRVVVEISTL